MTARDQNRAAFPLTAALVDDLRAAFGDGVQLVWLDEAGQTRGKRQIHPPARTLHAGQLTLRRASAADAPTPTKRK